MKKKVEIVFVLDRSGSMSQIRNSAINGFNSFVSQQRELNPEAKLSLIQFDDEYEVNYESLALKHVNDLNTDTFVPRGLTALHDAMGKSLISTRERLKNDSETKVIFVVLTDGYENSSQEFNKTTIKKLVEEMEEKYQWEIIYLGANQDAIKESSSFGIKASKSITFDAEDETTENVFKSLSHEVYSCMSLDKKFSFKDDDRKKARAK